MNRGRTVWTPQPVPTPTARPAAQTRTFFLSSQFALPQNSLEAVVLVTLPARVYSALISGVNDTTGVGLVEVYEVL
jgi:hypothetical protein